MRWTICKCCVCCAWTKVILLSAREWIANTAQTSTTPCRNPAFRLQPMLFRPMMCETRAQLAAELLKATGQQVCQMIDLSFGCNNHRQQNVVAHTIHPGSKGRFRNQCQSASYEVNRRKTSLHERWLNIGRIIRPQKLLLQNHTMHMIAYSHGKFI